MSCSCCLPPQPRPGRLLQLRGPPQGGSAARSGTWPSTRRGGARRGTLLAPRPRACLTSLRMPAHLGPSLRSQPLGCGAQVAAAAAAPGEQVGRAVRARRPALRGRLPEAPGRRAGARRAAAGPACMPLPALAAQLRPSTPARARAQAAVVEAGGSPRMLFHAFSMAGWGVFAAMLRDMAASGGAPRLRDICGAVVDSAPQIAVRAPRRAARAPPGRRRRCA